MPRTAAANKNTPKNRPNKNYPPFERYKRLKAWDQLIVYYYWLYKQTKGVEGWDLDKAGYKEHHKQFGYILDKYTYNAFYSSGKKLAELALELAAEGRHLDQPVIAGVDIEIPRNEVEEKSSEEEEEESSDDDEEEEEEEEEATMPKTPSKKKAAEPSQPAVPTVTANIVPTPMVFGKYSRFNFTARTEQTVFVFRYLVHSFVREQDIIAEWRNEKELSIKVAWPDWWMCPEQQVAFDLDANNNPVFPSSHPLIGTMMMENEARKGDDNRVWDMGVISFNVPMSQEPGDTNFFVKALHSQNQGQQGLFIQIQVKVQLPAVARQGNTPITATLQQGVARPGNNAGKTSSRTRKKDDVDEDDDGMNTDENESSNKRTAVSPNADSSTSNNSQDLDDSAPWGLSSFLPALPDGNDIDL